MSKLRADITYSHRLHNDPSFIEPAIDINNTNQDSDNINDLENIGNPADNLAPAVEDSDSEEPDEEADESQLENEFADYLQGWADMLEEEENAEFDGDSYENDSITLNNITHPAINNNAKWVLENLFKDNINLPF